MMDRVKRYDAVHIRYEDNNIRYGEGCEVEMVAARDYDAMHAEAEALRAENAKLRTALAEHGERQEAACWVPRACLDKLRNGHNNSPAVLTDGPAEFNDTPLYTTPQPGPDVRSLVEALENCAAALAWNCFGECRAVHAGPIMPAAKALDTARAALAAHRQAQQGDSNDT